MLASTLGVALLSTTSVAMANSNLPFVGTRTFGFGGVPSAHGAYTLTIQKNGYTKLSYLWCSSLYCDDRKVLYSGQFKPIIAIYNEYDGGSVHLQFTKTKVKLLDKHKKQQFDCDAINENYGPCVSNYWKD